VWTNEIALLSQTEGQDRDGFPTGSRQTVTAGVPANFTDVTRNDEIIAMQQGYRAQINVELMSCNYAGERYLRDEATGQEYEVKRIFHKEKKNTVVLTCERRN
jgi:hypothetical protein